VENPIHRRNGLISIGSRGRTCSITLLLTLAALLPDSEVRYCLANPALDD
jgi:hypothetical protein